MIHCYECNFWGSPKKVDGVTKGTCLALPGSHAEGHLVTRGGFGCVAGVAWRSGLREERFWNVRYRENDPVTMAELAAMKDNQ
ncbi:MAG TPA: hypothetical protein VGK64_11910 [Bryobacteraceae bacterium]